MRVLFATIFLTALVLPTLALAEIQTFTATHTYLLGDDDSRNSARQKCLAEAKRKILEQVGVYLESKSELITSSQSTTSGSAKSPRATNEERQQITEQINTLAAGVMRTDVVKEEFVEVNGRLQITLTIKVKVDPDDIQRQLAARQVDASVRDDVAAQKERLKYLETQLEAMQRQGGQPSGQTPVPPTSDISAAGVQELRKRAAQGNATAQKSLGLSYYFGKGVPQDYAQARQWFEQAAAQGHAGAQYNLGVSYTKGQGVPQDYAMARQWFEKAAAQGDAAAQSNLGAMYANGYGVPQDYVQARQWYEKAAAQGDAVAQYSLGLLYAKGQGVPQDYAMARQWFEKAAAQGDAEAQFGMGSLYYNGHGVPQDYVRAYMWYNLAAAHSMGEEQKIAADNRDKVARLMTPAQIAEAQRLAQQCQARQFKGC